MPRAIGCRVGGLPSAQQNKSFAPQIHSTPYHYRSSLRLSRESLQNMKPADSAQGEPQGDLYQVRLRWLLDQRHPLYRLAEAVDWEFFAQELGPCT